MNQKTQNPIVSWTQSWLWPWHYIRLHSPYAEHPVPTVWYVLRVMIMFDVICENLWPPSETNLLRLNLKSLNTSQVFGGPWTWMGALGMASNQLFQTKSVDCPHWITTTLWSKDIHLNAISFFLLGKFSISLSRNQNPRLLPLSLTQKQLFTDKVGLLFEFA